METKVAEYEMAGIQEYWVVDPQRKIVLVHQLVHSKYAVEPFGLGQAAHSGVLDGFSVDLAELFGAAQGA